MLEQGATYTDLKPMARNSLEHSFIAGKSLWSDPAKLVMTGECSGARPGATLSPKCRDFLERNEKARLQWKLEEELRRFEEKNR